MDLLLLRQAIVLIASAIAAYTDWKTGLVFDKITYPVIAAGVILNVLEQQWIALAMGAAIFAIGYLFYFGGKIGGGDVKLFTGIALVLPFFGNGIFLLNVLFVSAVSAVVFFTVYFAGKYLLKKGFSIKENKDGIVRAAAIGVAIMLYLLIVFQLHMLSLFSTIALALPLLFGLVFLALEKGIRKEFFLKKVKVLELEEDELFAAEFEKEETVKLLGMSFKGVIGKTEIEKLKKAGIKEILVYRDAPRFAPFFFIGCIVAMALPDLLGLFFLKL